MRLGYCREYTNDIIEHTSKDLEVTGLNHYLDIIFPQEHDNWVHNERMPNSKSLRRPDYRNDNMKLCVEFDGLAHYQNPDIIQNDKIAYEFYENLGYRLIRVPYYLRLTNEVVYKLFYRYSPESFSTEIVPRGCAFNIKLRNTPAYMCLQGIYRFISEIQEFPEESNMLVKYLSDNKDDLRSGCREVQEVNLFALYFLR